MRKIKLSDGQEATVSESVYKLILEEQDEKLYYTSSTKGKVKISEMDDQWLKNAFIKAVREELVKQVDSYRHKSFTEIEKLVREGFSTESEEAGKLFNEISARVDKAEGFWYDSSYDSLLGRFRG